MGHGMRDLITTLLDVAGLVAVAVGVGILVSSAPAPWATGAGVLTAGVLILGGSQLIATLGKPAPRDQQEARR
jgi:hypothetical protein